MMKRGISFVTSLLMTASLTLVPMEEALIAPSSVVFAADAAPIIKVKDVTVPVGEDSVLVPVTIEGKDVASVTLSVEVNSKDSKEANPEVTGVKDGKFAGAQAQDASKASASNKRNILWVDDNDTEGKEFKNDQVFLVEVKLPKGAKENSQYTVKISSVSIAGSSKKDYELTDQCDYEGLITVGSKVLDGFTTRMDDQKVKAGSTVEVPMFIKCSEALGSIIGSFEVTGGAEITGLSTDGSGFDSDDYTFAENNKSLFNWTVYEYGGYKISGEQQLISVQVKIPSNAKSGDVFTLSLKDDFDVALGNRATVNPENYASAKLTVEADEVKTAATLTIGSKEVEKTEATVDLPVYVKTTDKNGIASVVANFKITNSDNKVASIKSIEAGAAIDENDFSVSDTHPERALWVVNSTTDSFFKDDNAQLFVLKITLPENREVGDIYTVDFDGKADVADSTKKSVSAEQKSGTIKIVKAAETTTVETTTSDNGKETTATTIDTTVTTSNKETTVNTTETTKPKETTVNTTETTKPKETTVNTTETTKPDETTVSSAKETTATTITDVTTTVNQPDKNDDKVIMNIGTVSGKPGEIVELPIKVTAEDLRGVTGDFIFENNYAEIADVITEIGSNMSGSKNVNKIVWTYEDSATESPDYNDEVWMTLKVKISEDIPENVSSISVTFEGSASTHKGVGKIRDSVLEVNDGKINIDKFASDETSEVTTSDETTAETTTKPKETTAETTTNPKETTVETTTNPKETTAETTTNPKETTAETTKPKETTAETTKPKETTAETTTNPKETTVETTTNPKETTAETTVTKPKETTAETTTTNPKETTAETTTTNPKETTAETTTTNPKETTAETTTNPKETTAETTTNPKETTAESTTTEETTSVTTETGPSTTEVTTTDESDYEVTTSIKWNTNENYNYIKHYPNTIFYFAFEKEFDLSDLSIEVDTVDSTGKTSKMVIPNSELVLSYTYKVKDENGNTTDVTVKNCNPNTVYYETNQVFRDSEDGSKFKYTIDVSYMDKKVGSFNVYIGEMGDVNLDHEVDPEDGTYILRISNSTTLDFYNFENNLTRQEPFLKSKIDKFVKENKITLEDGEFDTYMNFAYFLGDVSDSSKYSHSERNRTLTEVVGGELVENREIDAEDGTYVLKYYNQITMNIVLDKDEDTETVWKNLLK